MLEELILLPAIGYGLYYYRKQTRLQRQRQKFENTKKEMEALGRHDRMRCASKTQKKDTRELARIAKGHLKTYETEIPPRLFQSANQLIDHSVKELRFELVYDIYIILLNTNRTRVFSELEQFVDRSD